MQLQLLYISEIGIVTDNVHALVTQLKHDYHLMPFVKQPVLENFAAIGNEEGLLILSVTDRHWCHTVIPAIPLPIRIIMDINNNGKTRELIFY